MRIKHILFAGLVLVVGGLTVQAQQNKTIDMGKLHYGIKAGGNLSNVILVGNTQSTVYDYKSRIGFYAGGYAEYPILDFLSARMELYYNNIGTRASYLNNPDVKISQRSNYLSLPVLAKASHPSFPELYATLGFGFNIRLSYTYIVKEQPPTTNYIRRTNMNEYEKGLNMVFLAGVGYHLTDDLAVEIGFGRSLNTPFKSIPNSSVYMFRHQYLQLGMTYKLK